MASDIVSETFTGNEKPEGFDASIRDRYAEAVSQYYVPTPVGGANKEEIRQVISAPVAEKAPDETGGDVERGFSVEPIDDLLAQLDATEAEWAHLRALHGPYGKWDNLRKNLLSAMVLKYRGSEPPKGATSWTEKVLEAAAHADPDYQTFVNRGIQEAAEYIAMDAQREGIWARINRGQALLRTVRFT